MYSLVNFAEGDLERIAVQVSALSILLCFDDHCLFVPAVRVMLKLESERYACWQDLDGTCAWTYDEVQRWVKSSFLPCTRTRVGG